MKQTKPLMSDNNGYNKQHFYRGHTASQAHQYSETQAQKQTQQSQQKTPFTVWVAGEYWLKRTLNYWLEKGWCHRREASRHTAAKGRTFCFKRKTKKEPTGSWFAIGLRSAENEELRWEQLGGASSHQNCLLSHTTAVSAWWCHMKHLYSPPSFVSPFHSTVCLSLTFIQTATGNSAFPLACLTPPNFSNHHSLNPSFFSSQRQACPVHQFPTCQTGFVAARDCQNLFHCEAPWSSIMAQMTPAELSWPWTKGSCPQRMTVSWDRTGSIGAKKKCWRRRAFFH